MLYYDNTLVQIASIKSCVWKERLSSRYYELKLLHCFCTTTLLGPFWYQALIRHIKVTDCTFDKIHLPSPCIISHGWGRSIDLGLWLSNGAILIYHPVFDNQLVVWTFFVIENHYTRYELRLFGAKAFHLLLLFYVCRLTGLEQVPFFKSLVWLKKT